MQTDKEPLLMVVGFGCWTLKGPWTETFIINPVRAHLYKAVLAAVYDEIWPGDRHPLAKIGWHGRERGCHICHIRVRGGQTAS